MTPLSPEIISFERKLALFISEGLEGGIGVVEMLNRSNILGLAGGGKNPAFPMTTVVIWEDSKDEGERAQGEIYLPVEVKNIKLRLN